MSEHDIEHTKYPVCPHCGYKHHDVWEWDFGCGLDGEIGDTDCDSCGKSFFCSRSTIVSYTTIALQPKGDE